MSLPVTGGLQLREESKSSQKSDQLQVISICCYSISNFELRFHEPYENMTEALTRETLDPIRKGPCECLPVSAYSSHLLMRPISTLHVDRMSAGLFLCVGGSWCEVDGRGMCGER